MEPTEIDPAQTTVLTDEGQELSLDQIYKDKNGIDEKEDKGNRSKGADEEGSSHAYLLAILSFVVIGACACVFCRYCKGRTRSEDRSAR